MEDNTDLTAYLSMLLSPEYQLLSARNGLEGLEQAFEHLPDLVLSDVMMPGMDGLEFCRVLKNDPRTSHIPVVMLTARAGINDRLEGLQYGADAWLAKPFERAELFTTLAAQLESRRRLRVYFENLAVNEDFKNGQAVELQPIIQKEHEFLTRVRACVDARLSDETYDIPQLCRDLAMSRMQLHRKLTALGSPSAALFVRAHRLSKAKNLLETTDCTIAEAAFDTGFSDPAYFTRCFREAYGKPPSEWRKG